MVIHSFPYSWPGEFPLELEVIVTVEKEHSDPVEMKLNLIRAPNMKGVTRAVYNIKGGEYFSVFKLAVMAPQETFREGAQDGS